MKTSELIFNPFKRYAGGTALIAGLVVIFITAACAVLAGVHLDGVIDLHVGTGITFIQSVGEGLINFLSMGILLYISSILVSRSNPRLIDVFGTQALARTPYFFATLANALPDQEKVINYFESKYLNTGEVVDLSVSQIIAFAFATLVTIICLIWMISLMYKAYSVSANVTGAKAIVSFIVGLILAEVLSKFLINSILL